MTKTSLKRATSSWQPTVTSAKGKASSQKTDIPVQAKSEDTSPESIDLQGYRELQPSDLVDNVIASPLGGMGASFPSDVGDKGNELIAPRSSVLGSMGIQAKLTIGEPNDAYEQEADRVARRVVDQINAPAPVQRHTGEEELQMKPQ